MTYMDDTISQADERLRRSNAPTIPRKEQIARGAIRASSLLVLLFLFHNQVLGDDTSDALHQRILIDPSDIAARKYALP
jgi:hypothetical protein